MNNERYNQIIDEVYRNYANSHFTPPKNPNSKLLAPQLWSVIPMQHNKESFIHEIKTNPKFSKKWGLMIKETYKLVPNKHYTDDSTGLIRTFPVREYKLIVVYKDEIIEIYE